MWATRIFATGDGEAPSARPAPRVLVADDSPEMLELMSAWLEDEGCIVIAVGSGREALQASALNRPDVAFIDVVLPPPDGYQVCEMLTQGGGPAVVLMTGTSNPDVRRVGEAGGLRLLRKPFVREAVVEALKTALEYSRRSETA